MSAFPVIKIVTGALLAPLGNLKGLGLSVLALVGTYLSIIVAGAAGGLFILGMGSETGLEPLQDIGALGAILSFLFLIFFVFAGTIFGMVFNYWVRYGAGIVNPTIQQPWKAAAWQGLKNFVKFILIGIAIAIIAFVVIAIMGLLGAEGLTFDSFMQSATAKSLGDKMQMMAVFSVVTIFITCFAYALFSASLTKTALDNPDYETSDDHVPGFAASVFILYMISYLPVLALAYVAPDWLVLTVNMVLSFYLFFAVPIAHGLRYNYCRAEPDGF